MSVLAQRSPPLVLLMPSPSLRPPDSGGPDPGLYLPPGSPPPPAAGRRPADVWVPRGVSGFAEAWDFSVSSLLRTYLSTASPTVADVFHEVEARKCAFQGTAASVAERGPPLSRFSWRLAGERRRGELVPGFPGSRVLDCLRVTHCPQPFF